MVGNPEVARNWGKDIACDRSSKLLILMIVS